MSLFYPINEGQLSIGNWKIKFLMCMDHTKLTNRQQSWQLAFICWVGVRHVIVLIYKKVLLMA